jgi:hypothetical protein
MTEIDDLYDISKYSDKELYDILDMNNPTDRELEAKIIHLINKYDNMQNESGDKLSLFFQNIYNHFFNDNDNEGDNKGDNENKTIDEGFENPKQISPSEINNFEMDDTNALTKLNSGAKMVKQLTQEITDTNKINTQRQIGNEIKSVQQFDYSKDNRQLNPILKQTIKRIISIDSQYRNIRTDPNPTSFSFDLSEPLKDVVSLKLYSVQIPYTWYTIPQSYGSNFFYLKGVTSGINDGNHDYKIEISHGNYSPSELKTAINQSFYDISNKTPTQIDKGLISASDVNFNSNEIISFNENTCKMTINLDLQKVYTETYYELILPRINNGSLATDRTITDYLGFNRNVYSMSSITSNNKYFTTENINNTSQNQNYILDSSNNYFTVSIYDENNNIINSYKIVLKTKQVNNIGIITYIDYTTTTGASRLDIINSLNETLKINELFEPKSSIYSVDEGIYTYYKLTIIFNRYLVKYKPYMNIKIDFPTETSRDYRIWTYKSVNHNCFFFDNISNDLSKIASEGNSTFSSYDISRNTNILLTCNKDNYKERENDILINIPEQFNITLPTVLDKITQSFSNTNYPLVQFYTTSSDKEQKGAYIDASSNFNLTVDLEKTFTTEYYNVSWGDTSLLSTKKANGSFNIYNINNVAWTVNQDLSSNINKNIFGYSIKGQSGGYNVDISNIFTIKPIIANNSGNKNASSVIVSLPSTINFYDENGKNIGYTFNNIELYTKAINDAIQNTVVDNQKVLSASSFISRYNNSTERYDLSLNIVYNYQLTEKDYDISFSGETNNIWQILDISSNYKYTLSNQENVSANQSYSIIRGKKVISGFSFLTVGDSNNTIILQTNTDLTSNSQYNIPNEQIILQIQNGQYTNYTLCSAINRLFDANPKLRGSIITQIPINSILYTQLQLKINNIYTTKDYNIVFYDPVSFAKCFVGSRSIQTTSWDSTLGWILGFRDYTQYSLILDNVQQFGNNTIYLISSTGKYTYIDITINGITKNVSIILVADTTVSTNLYNYFLISLDDFIQNHLNDGLVTITRKETSLSIPNYLYKTTQVCDPVTNTLTSTTMRNPNLNGATKNQLYSLNQSIYSQRNQQKTYSSGPFIKDLFGFIPIKVPSKNGDYYIEFGGSLQSQERLYFGPVNIRKMSIQLLNDRGDLVDLNNTNWSFSFICEQLYSNNIVT